MAAIKVFILLIVIFECGTESVDDVVADIEDDINNYEGDAYEAADFSINAEKGAEGYKQLQDFDKALKRQHEAEGHKGFYKELGRSADGKNDESTYYSKADAAARAHKGADFDQSDSYRKGSKTTGHHKVYHKDEYKKDQKFYDESEKSGHIHRYGDYEAAKRLENGNSANGGKYSSAHKEGSFGNQGFIDRGARSDSAAGHSGASGNDEYYSNHAKGAQNIGY